jgi:cytochrome c556
MVKTRHWSSRLAAALITTLLCLTITTPSQAEEQTLKETMRGLLINTQAIVEGVMREDYAKIASMAEAIAFHQSPSPSKRMAILNELGMESMTFTLFDDGLRKHATKLKKAAEQRDQEEVMETLADMMQSCTNCHNSYRKRLRNLK